MHSARAVEDKIKSLLGCCDKPGLENSMPEAIPSGGRRLAYLVSNHPIVSQAFVLREIMGLRELGFEVEVISIGPPDRPLEELSRSEQAEVRRTFYVKTAGAAAFLKAHLAVMVRHPAGYLRTLVHAVRLGLPNLVELLYHAGYFLQAGLIFRHLERRGLGHFQTHFVSPAGLLAAQFGPITMSMRVHGSDEFYDATRYRVAEKVRGSSFVCAVSVFTRSQLMRLTAPAEWDKFEVAPLGVDPAEFPPRPFNESPASCEILCVARLVPAKGHRVLLAALEWLVCAGRDVRLRLVGEGPDRAALERITEQRGLAGRVCFEGAVNQDHIRALYRQADLFVLPSFSEGVPVVLMEAMAMGIPCVSTRAGGIPELIRDGVDGLLVGPSDAEELARALDRLILDGELRRALGEAGRRRILEKYDFGVNIRQLAAILERRIWGRAEGSH